MFHRFLLLLLIFASFPVFASDERNQDSLLVYVFLSETCPICKSATTELRKIKDQHSSDPVNFYAVFPNNTSTTESISTFAKKYRISWNLSQDNERILTQKFAVNTTPEVIVINKRSGEIVYRGLIDNGYVSVGKRRQIITEHYLSEAINQYISGIPVSVSSTIPVGCFIQKQVSKK